MNGFDLIVYLVLALAVWDGWRRGLILQICSLVGLFAGIWLAARFGVLVGGWLHLNEPAVEAGGFVIVLLITILAVALVGRALRKIFHFAGFGIPDVVLGAVVAVVKYLLLLSVLFSAFDRMNVGHTLVKANTIQASRCYRPVMHLSDQLFPSLHWIEERIPNEK